MVYQLNVIGCGPVVGGLTTNREIVGLIPVGEGVRVRGGLYLFFFFLEVGADVWGVCGLFGGFWGGPWESEVGRGEGEKGEGQAPMFVSSLRRGEDNEWSDIS